MCEYGAELLPHYCFNPNQSTMLYVHIKGIRRYISEDQVMFLEGDGNYSRIFLSSGQDFLSSRTLAFLKENVSENFIRPHKSYLVNRSFVRHFDQEKSCLEMKNRKVIPISRRKLKRVAKEFPAFHQQN